jgi:hypothetical protein
VLIVSDFSPFLVSRGFASISPAHLEIRHDEIESLRRAGFIEEIYFVKTPVDDFLSPNPSQLDAIMGKLKTVQYASRRSPEPITIFRLTAP